jgi:hypothetical protein
VAVQPIASVLMTAAQRAVLTAADFQAGAPMHARITNIAFVSGIEISYDHSAAGPHYLELSPDNSKTAIAVPLDKPFVDIPVWPMNQAVPASHTASEPNRNWLPPFACSQLDLYFRTNRFPNTSGWFKPSGDIIVTVWYYPSVFV